MRILEARGVAYDAYTFDSGGQHVPAAAVAALVGLVPEQIFKTLVALPERPRARPLLALVPASAELDRKKLAVAAGEKGVAMASHQDAERLTGLRKGGISPLALQGKRWPVFVDASVQGFDRIWISAGRVGCGLVVEVPGLLDLLAATVADIARSARRVSPGDPSP